MMASEQAEAAVDAPTASSGNYHLHVFPFSLYSIMARLTLAFGQDATSPTTSSLSVRLKLVNLHREDHISEAYLTEVNPKGQVPALTGGTLTSPLTDSLDISYFFCQQYPCLLPEKQSGHIKQLLKRLHQIQALSLSVPKEDRADGVPCPTVDALLAGTEISQKYRHALQHKRMFHKQTLENALEDANVNLAEAQAKVLFEDITTTISAYETSPMPCWIFGEDIGATVLDAHCAAFIARLMDCGRHDLISEKLQRYAHFVMAGRGWQSVIHGRSTMWDVSVGHVHLLKDL